MQQQGQMSQQRCSLSLYLDEHSFCQTGYALFYLYVLVFLKNQGEEITVLLVYSETVIHFSDCFQSCFETISKSVFKGKNY